MKQCIIMYITNVYPVYPVYTPSILRPMPIHTQAHTFSELLGGHFCLLCALTYKFTGLISWNMGS